MKKLTIFFVLPFALLGCRATTVTSIKEAGLQTGGPGYHCTFASPRNQTEMMEVWVDATVNGDLRGLRVRYDANADSAGEMRSLASPPPVDGRSVTLQGRRELRSFFKGLLEVDFGKIACADLYAPHGGDSASASFFCMFRAKNEKGEREAYWMTNQSSQKFAAGLTVYQTVCVTP